MLLMLAAAVLVTADPPAQPVAAVPATVAALKPVKERRICRTTDDSSTRMGRRVCKTEKEWNGEASDLPDGIAGLKGGQPGQGN